LDTIIKFTVKRNGVSSKFRKSDSRGKRTHSLEGEGGTDTVSGSGSGSVGVTELARIKGETKGCFDSWSKRLSVTESDDTSVVDLGLDESSVL